MRLAVLADIHGNILALEAVLADLAGRGCDRVVDLGDCVSGPLWPRETMARLAALGAATVRGNHDRLVAAGDPAGMGPSDRFAAEALTAEERERLGGLPPTLAVAPGILACHARPRHDELYLLDDIRDGRLVRAAPDAIARRVAGVDAAIVLCGHSHRPDFVRVPGALTVLNPGSVGCPAYEDPVGRAHVSGNRLPARPLCHPRSFRRRAPRRMVCAALRLGGRRPPRRTERPPRLGSRPAHRLHAALTAAIGGGRYSAFAASSTSSAWPGTETFGQMRAMRPSASRRIVVRSMPI